MLLFYLLFKSKFISDQFRKYYIGKLMVTFIACRVKEFLIAAFY